MKKQIIITFTLLLSVFSAFAQVKKINVYLLGTFHFNQVDTLAYDVRDEKHQKSIKELSDKIIHLKPDKVFVERMPEWEHQNKVDSLYQEYKKGNLREQRNEIWQVGARVAAALDHKQIFQCDQPGMYGFLYSKLLSYTKKHQQQDQLAYRGKGMTTPLTAVFSRDSMLKSIDLLEYIRWLNSKNVLQSSHAHYINVYPQIGNTNVFHYDSTYFLGANLTIDWYRRNILIYSKMLAQLDYTENSLFLIIGNDHIPILKELFNANPYFQVMETEEWLGKANIKNKKTAGKHSKKTALKQ